MRIPKTDRGVAATEYGPLWLGLSRVGNTARKTAPILVIMLASLHLAARQKDNAHYGESLIVNVPYPEAEVLQVVQDVVSNGIIRGTKEYNKDPYIKGAVAAESTKVFPEWTEGGRVFYKVRYKALDPQNFKDTNDVGTLAVRYVVREQDATHTVLRIDARYFEDYRHISHPSNGSVEGAEYGDIHDKLDAMESMKNAAVEAEKEKLAKSQSAQLAQTRSPSDSSSAEPPKPEVTEPPTTAVAAEATPAIPLRPAQTLEERVKDLRRQVERQVKSPGAALRAAPFHTAATLQSLPTGTQVLVEISTPYWVGVEIHNGQHGWVLRDELEQVP